MNFAVNIARFFRITPILYNIWSSYLIQNWCSKKSRKFIGKLCWSLQVSAVTWLKITLAQVFSCKFWQNFENIFFVEHLWTTASAKPYKCRHINMFWELAFSKYLLQESLLLILCWSFKSTWSFLRNTVFESVSVLVKLRVFLKMDSGRAAFYKLCELSGRLLLSNAKNILN